MVRFLPRQGRRTLLSLSLAVLPGEKHSVVPLGLLCFGLSSECSGLVVNFVTVVIAGVDFADVSDLLYGVGDIGIVDARVVLLINARPLLKIW